MSDRADARRPRAPERAASPLSQLAGAGRTGSLLAISTGLIAAVAGPAQAAPAAPVPAAPPPVAAPPVAAPAVAAPAFSAVTGASPLATSTPVLAAGGAGLTAPSTAVVSFESGTFTAVPRPAPPPRPRVETVDDGDTSRSTTSSENARTVRETGTDDVGAAAGGSSVLSIAARYVGTPYLYGGTTPRGFDCSGYTQYVYAQLGISLPRTADQQMNATRRVSRSEARPGDLVFFVSGGSAYHNGIYAGNGMMYDSPRSGKTVQKRAIWEATVVFGRVTG